MKSIYWAIVASILIFGIFMSRDDEDRNRYILLMTFVHFFICAFRYQFITGDLIKYHSAYQNFKNYSYTSKEVINGWRNTGFYWIMKFFSDITNGNYQIFLIALALITVSIASYLIYRYSVNPWLSFLVFNCMNFYVLYDFLAIKQGLAMSVIMLAMICIFEEKMFLFFFFTFLAGFIHMPALIFLPAYFLVHRRVNERLIFFYLLAAYLIFRFRIPLANMFSDLYYEEQGFTLIKQGLGGKVIVILIILTTGMLIKGFAEVRFSKLFIITAIAAIIQTFSGFDNVFTRLADYYLQFLILFIPDIFYEDKGSEINAEANPPYLDFTDDSKRVFVMILVVVLIWWYHTTFLGVTISNPIDNFLNYRFMWQVK